MELAFQATRARNNVLAGMAGTHTPTYTVKTPISFTGPPHLTTFTRRDAEQGEEHWLAEVQWTQPERESLIRTQEQEPAVRLDAFLRRHKWYG